MGYVTVEFYKRTFHGNSIPDDCLQHRLDKASLDVDAITRMKIKRLGGFNSLSAFEQEMVQFAVCYQADYEHSKASMDGLSSYSIGDVSVNLDSSVVDYCRTCIGYLQMTRLMDRRL